MPTPGGTFGIWQSTVEFLDPQPPNTEPARLRVKADAAARIKVSKGGFFGSLFGKKKKVTIHVHAEVDLHAGVKKDLSVPMAEVAFKGTVDGTVDVSVDSVLAAVLMVVLQPIVMIFLPVLSQLLNIAVDKLLPLDWQEDVGGGWVRFSLTKLDIQLAGGGAILGLSGLSEATIKAKVDASIEGSFQLSHFIAHQIKKAKVDLKVGFEDDSLVTRQIGTAPTPAPIPGELFLGIELAIP